MSNDIGNELDNLLQAICIKCPGKSNLLLSLCNAPSKLVPLDYLMVFRIIILLFITNGGEVVYVGKSSKNTTVVFVKASTFTIVLKRVCPLCGLNKHIHNKVIDCFANSYSPHISIFYGKFGNSFQYDAFV